MAVAASQPLQRVTANVKRMIERLSTQREWANTGQGWQAKESLLRLEGWSRQRRVIILRRRVIALFYDWWSIFVRLVEPDRHMEAITSRPLLLHAIATRVRHARQTTITVASSHARALPAAKAFRAVAIFLRGLAKNAEQLTGLQRWRRILARAFQVFLQGRQLRSPPRLAPG